MALNSFYTRQAQEDALVTQITNPNRVGSGFINLGPQKRFATPASNWLIGGDGVPPPPQPLIDIHNAPRPSSNGLPPPPAAQNISAVQAPTPPAAPTFSAPYAEPNARPLPIGKNVQPTTSEAAPRQGRAPRVEKEAKKPPRSQPTNRNARPGGKTITSEKDEAALAAEAAAAAAAQLAEDERLARQLQQELLLEDAPPEPVAVFTEPRAEVAKRVEKASKKPASKTPASKAPQPASKTPAPVEATTDDATSKRVRALRKKVRDIELLEERQREGAILPQEQLDKIAGKAAIVKELGALACPPPGGTIDKEHGALATDDAASKRVRALRKKVRDVELLEERQREGAILEQNQLDKIAGKAAIVKELGALLA